MNKYRNIAKCIAGILLTFAICVSVVFLTGCNIDGVEDMEVATISAKTATENENLCSKADNKIDAGTIDKMCTLNDFNKYNIHNDVFSRITVSVYINEVNKNIGLPVLRKIGDSYYSVHPIKTDSGSKIYGFIMYSKDGKVIDGWCTDVIHTKSDYDKISKDSKLKDVKRIDPYCCFMENVSENTATSYHKLNEGKELVIDYSRKDENSDYIVTNIKEKNDPVVFTNMLLKMDLDLIKK